MSKYGVRPGALRISGTGLPGGTAVELDGMDITSAIDALSLRLSVSEHPTGVLNVLLHKVDTEVENPRLVVPDETRDLLVRLGWTPPAEESA